MCSGISDRMPKARNAIGLLLLAIAGLARTRPQNLWATNTVTTYVGEFYPWRLRQDRKFRCGNSKAQFRNQYLSSSTPQVMPHRFQALYVPERKAILASWHDDSVDVILRRGAINHSRTDITESGSEFPIERLCEDRLWQVDLAQDVFCVPIETIEFGVSAGCENAINEVLVRTDQIGSWSNADIESGKPRDFYLSGSVVHLLQNISIHIRTVKEGPNSGIRHASSFEIARQFLSTRQSGPRSFGKSGIGQLLLVKLML
jgi:hypothetical protein